MNTPRFIARRIAFSEGKSFTKVIIRIAIAAIAVSVAVMILTSSIIAGFKKEISGKIFGFWGNIHITDGNINRNFELTPIDKTKPFFDDIRNIKELVADDEELNNSQKSITKGGIKGVYPYIIMPSLMLYADNFHGVLLKGLAQEYDWDKLNQFIIEGKSITFKNDSSVNEIIISKNIAAKLKIPVGAKVIMSFVRDQSQIKKVFQVAGIYNTGLEEYDKRFGIVDIRKLQEILGWGPQLVQGMEVILDDVADIDILSEYIYYEILPQEYYAESIKSKFPSIFEWLNLQDINEKIIIQLMILVAIINMITVLLILILERTQMIGILKSLGMTNWEVRKVFMYNAAYIILVGLALGNLLGLGIGFLQKKYNFITLDEANYYLDKAPIEIVFSNILWINLGTFIVTLLFLFIPTFLVLKITPIKALRFE